jgi:hypothetical protein
MVPIAMRNNEPGGPKTECGCQQEECDVRGGEKFLLCSPSYLRIVAIKSKKVRRSAVRVLIFLGLTIGFEWLAFGQAVPSTFGVASVKPSAHDRAQGTTGIPSVAASGGTGFVTYQS